MSELKALAGFLQPYHDEVMGLERQALDALAKGDTEAYTASMKAKAEKMKALYPLTLPYLEKLPAAQAKRRSFPEVLRFTQTVQKEPLGVNAFVRRLYPETANKTVNREMKALIETAFGALSCKNNPLIPCVPQFHQHLLL